MKLNGGIPDRLHMQTRPPEDWREQHEIDSLCQILRSGPDNRMFLRQSKRSVLS